MMEYLINYLNELISLSGEMAPYLLLGFLFAGILHVFFRKDRIVKYLGKKNLKSVIYASLLGVPLPLCSCGVIPTGISFHRNGASKGSAVSFLISTPQTGVDSILVTYSMIGLPFALLRPVVAFFTGVFGGWLTNVTDKSDAVSTKEEYGSYPQSNNKNGKLYKMFSYAFVEFLQDISTYLIFGLLLAALMAVLIPDDFFTSYIGNSVVEMLIVLFASVPLYICATGSVPIAAVLLMKGLSPGAALVLLMAGPATNAATITVIGKTMGKKTLFTYLFSIIFGALFFGLLIDTLLPRDLLIHGLVLPTSHHASHLLPEWFKFSSLIILTLLILNAYLLRFGVYKRLFPALFKKNNSTDNNFNMKSIDIIVNGMTCNHCKNNVESNISKIEGIELVSADINTSKVTISGDEIDLEKIAKTVTDLGYQYKGQI